MNPAKIKELADILERADNREDLETLLGGLLTPREVDEFVKRWHLMVLLARGETHRDIAGELSISLGKIARGSRLLKYGPDTFRAFIEREIERDGGS